MLFDLVEAFRKTSIFYMLLHGIGHERRSRQLFYSQLNKEQWNQSRPWLMMWSREIRNGETSKSMTDSPKHWIVKHGRHSFNQPYRTSGKRWWCSIYSWKALYYYNNQRCSAAKERIQSTTTFNQNKIFVVAFMYVSQIFTYSSEFIFHQLIVAFLD